MKRMLFVLVLALAVLSGAGAGPLFDDYLNYVRPGTGTGPGQGQIIVTSAQPAGQSFTVPEGTAEIYRIGIRAAYDTWNPGEQVTMTLFDSPQKKQKLGEYTIDHATSGVGQLVSGNGSEFRKTEDRILYFQFRKPTEDRTQLYFELSMTGGDGKAAFQGFDSDAYPGGECTPAGKIKDISFACDIKPVADREANLRKFFTERLDISRLELATVKAAVDKGDWEKAIAETANHFHSKRMDLWDAWKDLYMPKPDPSADTATADLLLKGMVMNGETKQPIPWRKESYWAPEYPGKDPNHVMQPSPYLWHIDRALSAAYTTKGREEYAQKAIELRMQFILDNPNPKIVYEGQKEFPWYFELWSDRTSGARTPGHGDLVYARLYNYKGWTNDQKLVFICFIEENGRWVYKATSGANWGAEAARAAFDCGLAFPEFKMSKEYVRWGASRLAEISMEDVRRDGTGHEAAIKYHAMVARRLKGMLENIKAGRAEMEPDMLGKLTKVLEGMYEHMAYTLQPNSYVVMCGDSWYENFTEELADVGRMTNRQDFIYVATQGKQGTPPKQLSRVYPEAGYYIMRSDFGGAGKNYTDSKQMFVHNGGWSGSHGHWDLTCINLYSYGRTLVIDPGQYSHDPPPGISAYWESKIHSMLVMDGRNVKREPGPSEWASNGVIDWFDGRHFGYNHVDYVRRKIAFIKPDYFLVDDSVKPNYDTDWAQVWNLTDPGAKIDQATKTIETAFADGGNIMILSQDPEKLTVEEAPGISSSGEHYPKTKIFRLHQKTDSPRFKTLLYPYNTGAKLSVKWEQILPDDTSLGDVFYSVRVNNGGVDWAAFGEGGKTVGYRNGSHKANADFALVRMDPTGKSVTSFSWAHGRELVFSGKTLASADKDILSMGVRYDGQKLIIDAKEADASLAVRAGSAKSFVVNGQTVAKPVVKNGMFYPYADMPKTIIADDHGSFEKVTDTKEWARVADPGSFSTGFTHHETDLGRHENGDYVFKVPKAGIYSVEVYVPNITMHPSDRVDYRVTASGAPVKAGGTVVGVKQEGDAYVFTLDHQKMSGWVKLGDFTLYPGQFKVNAKNMTEIDGLYFVADAMRLVAKGK